MDSRLRVPTIIYDFFAEITRPKDGQEALVKSIYPKDHEMTEETRKQIPKFVWPMRTANEKEEHFTFVLTDLDSKYKFGFCRYPPKGESCMLFLSDLPWYKVFYRALDKISDLLLNHQIEVVEPFLKGLFTHPLPNTGVDTILSVVPHEVDTGQVYSFPLPNPKRLAEIPTDDNLTQFYTNLHYNVILHLFANMIFERRIIITSSSLSVLSATVHGAVLLLFPLHWQHIFIPITPPHLLDYCAAPMPFLMGVHSSYMDIVRRMPTDDIVILDVDESTIESAHVEDLTTLPNDVVSTLKHVLKKQSSTYGDTVTRSFLVAQVAMIGGYRSALKFRQGEKEIIFDEDQFLKSRPNMEEFLGQLLHFQHFRQFINSKIDKLKNSMLERDLFDNEVLAYEEELKGAEQMKVVFDKFISSTVEGSKKVAELGGKLGGNIRKQVKQAKIVMKKNLKHNKPLHYSNDQLNFNNPSIPGLRGMKTNSLPTAQKSSAHSRPLHGTITPPPRLDRLRKPPSVIPYHRHIEGKKKLAESLKQQSSPDISAGVLLSLTPPDTPRKTSSSADQSSLDQADRMSLNSAEVAVGNLIDVCSDPGPIVKNEDIVLDTISSTSVSTTSSSDPLSSDPQNSSADPPVIDRRHGWERFDDDDDDASLDRPPIPPPRSELEKLYAVPTKLHKTPPVETPPVELVIENPAQETISRPKSPFEDFSSSIAEALISNSEKKEDPVSASALATAGKELFETIEEEADEESVLESYDCLVSSSATPVLQPEATVEPTSSSSPVLQFTSMTVSTSGGPISTGSSTSNVNTTQLRTNLNPINNRTRLNSMNRQQQQQHYTTSILRPIPHEGTFSADKIARNANPFYSGSINAGKYPKLTPLSQRPSGPRSPSYIQDFPLPGSSGTSTSNSHRRPGRPPPPKPQPYSGDCQWSQQQEESSSSNNVVMRHRQSSAAFMVQRLPSLGEFDPFAGFLSSGTGDGLILENSNSSPLV